MVEGYSESASFSVYLGHEPNGFILRGTGTSYGEEVVTYYKKSSSNIALKLGSNTGSYPLSYVCTYNSNTGYVTLKQYNNTTKNYYCIW